MARVTNKSLMADLRGAIGNQIVFRVRNGKTFASKYPDMSRVKRSPEQRKENNKFRKAVAFAKSINNNPEKKAAYKVKKGKTVYNSAIANYLSTHK